MLSVETFTGAAAPLSKAALRQLLSAPHVFSPNRAEALSMLGVRGAEEARARTDAGMVAEMAGAGAEVVVLRCGEDGAAVYCPATEEGWRVPACAETRVVDVTGCGNAFCGAFQAARLHGEGLLEAALWGSAAASLIAEAQGLPLGNPHALNGIAKARREALRPRAEPLVL